MIRIVHFADVHLGLRSSFIDDRQKREDRLKDVEDSFIKAIDFCVENSNNVNIVLISGDLFDRHNPDQKTIGFAKGQLRRLITSKKQVFIIPGNHDGYNYSNSVYRTEEFKNVHLIKTPNLDLWKSIKIGEEQINIYGMAYSLESRPPFDNFKKENLPGYHIALIHGSIKGSPDWNLQTHEVPLEIDSLLKTKFDYIALGHYHNFIHHKENETHIVYPGSLETMRFGENAKKGLTVVDIKDGKISVNRKLEDFNKKILLDIVLNLEQLKITNEDDIVAHIEKKFKNPNAIVRITLTGVIPFIIGLERLREQVSTFFYFLKLLDKSELYNDNIIASLKNEKTIRSLFVKKLMDRLSKSKDKEQREIINHALKLGLSKLVSFKQYD